MTVIKIDKDKLLYNLYGVAGSRKLSSKDTQTIISREIFEEVLDKYTIQDSEDKPEENTIPIHADPNLFSYASGGEPFFHAEEKMRKQKLDYWNEHCKGLGCHIYPEDKPELPKVEKKMIDIDKFVELADKIKESEHCACCHQDGSIGIHDHCKPEHECFCDCKGVEKHCHICNEWVGKPSYPEEIEPKSECVCIYANGKLTEPCAHHAWKMSGIDPTECDHIYRLTLTNNNLECIKCGDLIST